LGYNPYKPITVRLYNTRKNGDAVNSNHQMRNLVMWIDLKSGLNQIGDSWRTIPNRSVVKIFNINGGTRGQMFSYHGQKWPGDPLGMV
jgi:hypothetical protein